MRPVQVVSCYTMDLALARSLCVRPPRDPLSPYQVKIFGIWVSTKIFSINLAGSPRRRTAWARAWPRVHLRHLAICVGADDPGDNKNGNANV